MGKTRDLFKKIRDTNGIFHAKIGTIKDTNSMNLTKDKDIKKRWQEYTGKLCKIDLNDSDNHDGVNKLFLAPQTHFFLWKSDSTLPGT